MFVVSLTVLDHPLAKHLITGLRDAETQPYAFRRLARSLTTMLVLEATRDVPLRPVTVRTPIQETSAEVLGCPLAVVPILRAGLGMLEPVFDLFPEVAVGYIGLERSAETAVARSYYSKLPDFGGKYVLVVDPMLATGGSASQAIASVKQSGATQVTMVSVIASPEGVAKLQADHPDVPIVVGALDRGLNEKKYIVPGLGDFGDRLYATEH